MNKLILILVIGSILLYSCGNSTNEKSYKQIKKAANSEHKNNKGNEILKLNTGEKWLVNEEMKPFIIEAEVILFKYIESQSLDYQTLVTQLKEKNSGLIKSCTMEGESHNELHKWLYPHIELIESLSKAKTVEEANKIITNLQVSFLAYNQYFL